MDTDKTNYCQCAGCKCDLFYDVCADHPNVGQMAVLCKDCVVDRRIAILKISDICDILGSAEEGGGN